MARSTKRLLEETLISLLEKKSLNEITVKELVEQAGVNRQTFYYNFKDIYDLLEWLFEERSKQLVEYCARVDDWREGFLETFRRLQKNRRLILNACGSLSRPTVERYLKTAFSAIIAPIIAERAAGLNILKEDLEFVTQMYVMGYVGLVFEWLDNGMTEQTGLYLDKFLKLVDGSAEYVLLKMAN